LVHSRSKDKSWKVLVPSRSTDRYRKELFLPTLKVVSSEN
jgi:hypothetical protein